MTCNYVLIDFQFFENTVILCSFVQSCVVIKTKSIKTLVFQLNKLQSTVLPLCYKIEVKVIMTGVQHYS